MNVYSMFLFLDRLSLLSPVFRVLFLNPIHIHLLPSEILGPHYSGTGKKVTTSLGVQIFFYSYLPLTVYTLCQCKYLLWLSTNQKLLNDNRQKLILIKHNTCKCYWFNFREISIQTQIFLFSHNSIAIYLLIINYRNTRTIFEIFSR